MARTLDASTAARPERPLAGRIFGLFTPHLNRYVVRIAGAVGVRVMRTFLMLPLA